MRWLNRVMLRLLIENTLDRRIAFMIIKDIGRVVTGKTPLTKVEKYYGGDIMFISPSDLHGDYLIEKSEKTITEEGLKSIESNIIKGISVLTGCIGWDMGNVAMCNSRCATNQQINAITDFNDELVDPKYIYYWLKGKKEYLFSIASVTRTPILSKSVFENIDIPLPSLKVQKKIVKLVSCIDEKIRKNNHINDYLEEMAKTIYNYWFIQFEFPDENGKPYKSSGGKMSFCNELNREIPQNWNYTSIGNITICLDSERIPLSNQQREGMKGSIPYYGATGIMDYVNRPIFSGNFVLLAEDGSVMDDNGNPILQRVSGDVWINNHTHVLQPVKGYSCRLLYLLLKDIPVSIIKTGSIQMKINQANLNNYNILSIPDAIRTQFINCVEPLDTKIMQIQQENNNLIQFRDWLLPMLMNGQATIEDCCDK